MRRRVAVLACLAAVGLTAPPAGAAGCPLLRDGRNDEARAWLDVVSADLDVQPGFVVAAIRLRDLGGAPDPTRVWTASVEFRPVQASHVDELAASFGPAGTTFHAYRNGDVADIPEREVGPATGRVDPATGVVTIAVPRSAYGDDVADGAQLAVDAWTAVGVAGVVTYGADDTGDAMLRVGRRGCLPVWR